MVRWVMVAALCCAAGAVAAQTVMDGTDRIIGEANIAGLKRLLRGRLNDPYGSQLIELDNITPDRVCGQVNARNAYGALVGFRVFGADLRSGVIALQPAPLTRPLPKQELEQDLKELNLIKKICTP